MPGLVTVVTHNLASASSYHTTMTTTFKSPTVVTVPIIIIPLIVYPIGVIGALSHEVITVTLIFIMSY